MKFLVTVLAIVTVAMTLIAVFGKEQAAFAKCTEKYSIATCQEIFR